MAWIPSTLGNMIGLGGNASVGTNLNESYDRSEVTKPSDDGDDDLNELEELAKGLSLAETPVPKVAPSPAAQPDPAALRGVVLCEALGSLALLTEQGALDKKSDSVLAVLIDNGEFFYELRLFIGDRPLLTQPITQSMNPVYEKAGHAVVWLSFHQAIHAWRFEFADESEEKKFKMQLAMALMQQSRREDISALIKGDDTWFEAHTADAQPEEPPTDDDEDVDWADGAMASPVQTKQAKGKATSLACGSVVNRTFVVRGTSLEVSRFDQDDQLEYLTSIPAIRDLTGETFVPLQTLLQQRDERMLMLHPTRTDVVCAMDMNRGEVVEEYRAAEGFAVRNFGSKEKYSVLTNEQTFTGVSNNAVFSIDPRISGRDKLGDRYIYQRAPKLSCVATTASGGLAVGSALGEIRLFKGADKKANVNLPGLGDPIIGIDVTEAGDYVLATTEHYLLLVPTALKNDAKRRTGFDVKMNNAQKPVPIKLQLRHQDVIHYGIDTVKFTPATFNTGANVQEQWIVASTGAYIITWNLKHVKQGRRDYIIKKEQEDIAHSKFRFDKQDQVVVNSQNELFTERLRNRQK